MLAHADRYAWLLAIFLGVYPFVIYPTFLMEVGLGKAGVFSPDGEKAHLIPRLSLLSGVALLGWRFWRVRGLFAGLLLGEAFFVLASSLNATDPAGWVYTLFGPKNRMDGLIYHLMLMGLGLAAYQALRVYPEGLPRLLWAVWGAGVGQAVLVLLQSQGVDPVGFLITGQAYSEYKGSLGHTGVAGGLFLAAILASLGLLRTRRCYVLVGGLLFIAFALGLTQNRAAAYALVGVVLLYGAFGPGAFSRRLWLGAGLLSMMLLAQIVPDRNPIERGYTNPQTLHSRFVIWRLTLEALPHIRGAPFLGGGPDALLLALTHHFSDERLLDFYRVEHAWPEGTQVAGVSSTPPDESGRGRVLQVRFAQGGQAAYLVWLDKAHNLFLDRLVSYGLFAALVWMTLWLYPVYRAWRQGLRESPLWLLSVGLWIYYLAWFPVVPLEPIHLVLLAGVWAEGEERPTGSQGKENPDDPLGKKGDKPKKQKSMVGPKASSRGLKLGKGPKAQAQQGKV